MPRGGTPRRTVGAGSDPRPRGGRQRARSDAFVRATPPPTRRRRRCADVDWTGQHNAMSDSTYQSIDPEAQPLAAKSEASAWGGPAKLVVLVLAFGMFRRGENYLGLSRIDAALTPCRPSARPVFLSPHRRRRRDAASRAIAASKDPAARGRGVAASRRSADFSDARRNDEAAPRRDPFWIQVNGKKMIGPYTQLTSGGEPGGNQTSWCLQGVRIPGAREAMGSS